MTTVQIDLPDELAQNAQQAGLLTSAALARLLADALCSRALVLLDSALAALDADPLPPMSEEEIQAEIDAYRAERRAAARP
jgi:hypothetical protein